jgi:hypothetical protein
MKACEMQPYPKASGTGEQFNRFHCSKNALIVSASEALLLT